MPMIILDSSTAVAVEAATTQDGQADALVADWAGGAVTAHIVSGVTVLEILTLAAWVINETLDPVEVYPGSITARTWVQTGTPTSIIFLNGATEIFSVDCGIGSGSVQASGTPKELCEIVFDSVIFTANSALTPSPASQYGLLSGYLATMAAGDWDDISAESNITNITGNGGASGDPDAGWLESASNQLITSWVGKFTWDSTGKKLYISGASAGYSSEAPTGTHSKVVTLDVTTLEFSHVFNPFSINISHIYDANPSVVHDGYVYRRPFNNSNLYRADTATMTWASYLGLGSAGLSTISAVDFFPTLGASGSWIFVGLGKVVRYDIAGATFSTLSAALTGATGTCNVCSYHPGADIMVVGGGETGASTLYTIDNTGTITQLTVGLPGAVPGIGPHSTLNVLLLPDPLNRAIAHVLDPTTTNEHYTLNLSTGAWTLVGSLPAAMSARLNIAGACLPEPGCIILYDGQGRSGAVSNSKLWVWKAV